MEKINPHSVEALLMLQKVMVASGNSPRSVAAYVREIRFICNFYPQIEHNQWTDIHIVDYKAYRLAFRHLACRRNASLLHTAAQTPKVL